MDCLFTLYKILLEVLLRAAYYPVLVCNIKKMHNTYKYQATSIIKIYIYAILIITTL